MCTHRVFNRDEQEMSAKKCYECGKPLSKEEQDKRKPLPPDVLVGAMQDRVEEIGEKMCLWKRFNKWLCKKLGHKNGWLPAAPWWCDRCGEDFKEEWDKYRSEIYYARMEELAKSDGEWIQKHK